MMKSARLAGPVLTLLVAAAPAWGAPDPRIADFALCRQSWLDLQKSDPAALDEFGAYLRSEFTNESEDGHLAPKSPLTMAGLAVTQLYPGSVGMGLGFSVLVDAPFDTAKAAVEGDLGQPLGGCEASDGMRTCELSIAEQRTVVLMSGDAPGDTPTLVGCYYYYEK